LRHVGILEAKTHLSKLIEEVRAGGEVVITRHGAPVARLVSPAGVRRASADAIDRVFALREAIARESPSKDFFDWKAAVEDGRP
jgi:prevent-host-death family protein